MIKIKKKTESIWTSWIWISKQVIRECMLFDPFWIVDTFYLHICVQQQKYKREKWDCCCAFERALQITHTITIITAVIIVEFSVQCAAAYSRRWLNKDPLLCVFWGERWPMQPIRNDRISLIIWVIFTSLSVIKCIKARLPIDSWTTDRNVYVCMHARSDPTDRPTDWTVAY